MLPDRLVQGLAVAALFAHTVHQDVLRGHEGELVAQVLFHDGGVDPHAAGDVDDEVQNRIGAEEGLRDAQAAVGRVIQRTLQPLGRGGDGGVLHVADEIARKRADPLGAHRVALVGHGRGADLMRLKGLVDLLEVAQKPDIGGEFRRALRDAGEHLQHGEVRLAGIGLAGNGLAGGKAQLLRDHRLEPFGLFRVTVEQGEKARRRAGRALAAEELQLRELKIELIEVKEQVVDPQTRPLAHGRGLGGLEVGVGQRRQRGVFFRKVRQRGDRVQQQAADEAQRLAHAEDIGVVPHIAARRAEMDDAPRLRAGLAVGQHVRHHVVAHLVLVARGGVIVDVADMRAQLTQLLVRDRQPQRLLALRQRDPEPAPGGELPVVGEKPFHLLVGIAAAERILVKLVQGHSPSV